MKVSKASGGRLVDEWVGRTANSRPPQHVRVRIFDRYEGRCYITGVKLRPGHWHLDHILALEDGGKNVESNLAPIDDVEHRKKTSSENSRRAAADAIRAKHIGAAEPTKHKIPGRQKPPKPERQQKDSPFAHLPPPPIARMGKP